MYTSVCNHDFVRLTLEDGIIKIKEIKVTCVQDSNTWLDTHI